ncbi:hypothetical protein J6590_018611 [Homalodisca vitripennis]|nr:hypothetical protein J6590_018611 [Homalodisca vitripennis]
MHNKNNLNVDVTSVPTARTTNRFVRPYGSRAVGGGSQITVNRGILESPGRVCCVTSDSSSRLPGGHVIHRLPSVQLN